MSEAPSDKAALENIDIQRILPHRYPMLLIDRVVEHERKQRIVAIKNVTANEPFFSGHFPGFPIMPGVLIVEAMAQAGGVLLLSEIEDRDSKLMVFSGIDNARFRKPVLPGDTLRLEVKVVGWRSSFAKMEGKAYVGDQLAAEAVLSCALVPRQDKKPEA
jgi:3-hydroxyacyl-[acyl-carrier-protein] dehydratase